MAKSYSNIINHLFYQPLLLTPARHAALLTLLELRLSGQIAGAGRRKNGLKADNDEEFSDDDELPGAGNPDARPGKPGADGRRHGDHPGAWHIGGAIRSDIAMSECGCSMESLGGAIDAAENDSTIKRMVFDYRTPGGSVTMIPETARKIRKFQKGNGGVHRLRMLLGRDVADGGLPEGVFHVVGSPGFGGRLHDVHGLYRHAEAGWREGEHAIFSGKIQAAWRLLETALG